MEINLESLYALIAGNEFKVTILSNASAYLNECLDNINWVGFYILNDNYLYLGPFQGKPACINIPVGKGVCGNTIKEGKTIVVDNVLEYKGHIACDSASRSEICVPIYINNIIYGLLDIDSPNKNSFNEVDKKNLEASIHILEGFLEKI